MNNQSYEPLYNLSVKKSNELVSAKYKSTLLENQVMAIALTRVEVNAANEKSPLYAKLYPGELKRLISDSTHIYRTLKAVSKTMVGHTMFLEDHKGNFRAHAIVTDATYEDGVFTVNFNEKLREHILGLEKNYTTLELSVLTGFKKNASFRIYELLKSEFYKSDPKVNNGRVDVEYLLSEFRFMIGLANADDQGVKNEMGRMGNNIDWDILYSKLDKKDRKYEQWYELVRNVIVPAQNELKEKSNIRFEFEGIKCGKKIAKIHFEIYPNEDVNTKEIRERQRIIDENKAKQQFNMESDRSERQLEMPRDFEIELYQELVGHNKLTKEDIDLLLIKAGGDANLVREAVSFADKKDHVYNYMGYIIGTIENKFHEAIEVETVYGSSEKADTINEIKQYQDENKSSIASSVWAKTKEKEDFPAFIDYMTNIVGLDEEKLELIYNDDEKTSFYCDWKVGRDIQI